MKLKKAMREEAIDHVKNDMCPNCGSLELMWGNNKTIDEKQIYGFECTQCRTRGFTVYKLELQDVRFTDVSRNAIVLDIKDASKDTCNKRPIQYED